MELKNHSLIKPSTIKVKVLTIKKYIDSDNSENLSVEDLELTDTNALSSKVAEIACFNKAEEEKLQQKGFTGNYILMKKLIK